MASAVYFSPQTVAGYRTGRQPLLPLLILRSCDMGRWCVSSLHYAQVCFADERWVLVCVCACLVGNRGCPAPLVSSEEISKNFDATHSLCVLREIEAGFRMGGWLGG